MICTTCGSSEALHCPGYVKCEALAARDAEIERLKGERDGWASTKQAATLLADLDNLRAQLREAQQHLKEADLESQKAIDLVFQKYEGPGGVCELLAAERDSALASVLREQQRATVQERWRMELEAKRDQMHEALKVITGEREECDRVLERVREIHMIDWATSGNLVAQETLRMINEALGDPPDTGMPIFTAGPAVNPHDPKGD